MMMIDLCAGLGGASRSMRDRGWHVLTVDNNPAFGCDITTDVCTWEYTVSRCPDLVWCSPPCTDFSRESMPWSRTGNAPDISIVKACWKLIQDIQPRFYVVENVRGAVPWFRPLLGTHRQCVGPFYLWHNLPLLSVDMSGFRKKESYSSDRPELRAMVPYALSQAVALVVEQQITIFDLMKEGAKYDSDSESGRCGIHGRL